MENLALANIQVVIGFSLLMIASLLIYIAFFKDGSALFKKPHRRTAKI